MKFRRNLYFILVFIITVPVIEWGKGQGMSPANVGLMGGFFFLAIFGGLYGLHYYFDKKKNDSDES